MRPKAPAPVLAHAPAHASAHAPGHAPAHGPAAFMQGVGQERAMSASAISTMYDLNGFQRNLPHTKPQGSSHAQKPGNSEISRRPLRYDTTPFFFFVYV